MRAKKRGCDAADRLSSWIAGWTALGFVVAFAAYLVYVAVRTARAREALSTRILVTGTRGKSGAVRLIHAALTEEGNRPYAKITGTAARELLPDGTEIVTQRFGPASSCEMNDSMARAAKHEAQIGVFECMAVTPSMIELVAQRMIRPHIVVIPTIRLDHLEEEGLTEQEIGLNILAALGDGVTVVTGVSQPDVVAAYREHAEKHNVNLIFVRPDETTPQIPGHHPNNIEIALTVSQMLGVDRETALRHIDNASFEPKAQTYDRIVRDDGSELLLVDIGAANDPESAEETFVSLGLEGIQVTPVIVNRWERPLRSLTFIGGTHGRFAKVGIAGSLMRWSQKWQVRANRELSQHMTPTEYVRLPLGATRNAERLWQWAGEQHEHPNNRSRAVVLFENVHERKADALRKLFARQGEERNQVELRPKHV